METMQPWATGFNRPKPLPMQMPMQRPLQQALSREEQLEARRLAEESNFSYAGYQVVRREFISHRFDPAMTVRFGSVTFNNACIKTLEDATYVQFLINPTEKKLIVRRCDSGARDAIRWCVVRDETRKSRQITCKPFTERLYAMMGWEPGYRYRFQGMRIRYYDDEMYLFDLGADERFAPAKKDENGKITCKPFTERLYAMMGWEPGYRYRFQGMRIRYYDDEMYLFDLGADERFAPAKKDENGKRIVSAPVLPENWNGSYGLSVEEHDMSTQVDFLDNYRTVSDVKEETPAPEESDEN